MWFIIIIVIICIVAIIFSSNKIESTPTDKKYAEKEYVDLLAEFNRKQEEDPGILFASTADMLAEKHQKYNTLIKQFGECSANIELIESNSSCENSNMLIFEQSSMIVLLGKEYKFSDILGCSLADDATSETITTTTGDAKTSTGSMIGRAVVGGILTGGLGAVAGAATAKKSINTDATSQTITKHQYTIYVNVNSLENPTIKICVGDDSEKAYKLVSIFNVIIERNKN